jgi:hypothetical protein
MRRPWSLSRGASLVHRRPPSLPSRAGCRLARISLAACSCFVGSPFAACSCFVGSPFAACCFVVGSNAIADMVQFATHPRKNCFIHDFDDTRT